jgi:hypothetical protein
MRNTLIVMGSHPRTRNEFDWSRDDCDILVFNEAMKASWVQRADYVIQIHLPVIWRNPGNRNDPQHYAWLKSGATPTILMQDKYDDVPNSVRYPLEEVQKLGHRYLTSSAAYAIAWGIISGYERIEIYGVEMETNTEYAHQRPGVAYWIGLAKGAGVDVDYHGKLLDSPLYGYEGDIKFDYSYFDERIKDIQEKGDVALAAYNGNAEKQNEVLDKYLIDLAEPKEVQKIIDAGAELAAQFGVHNGAMQEVRRYKKKADDQKKATGDYLFSRQEFEHAVSSFIKQRDDANVNAKVHAGGLGKQLALIKMTNNRNKRKLRAEEFSKLVKLYIFECDKVGTFDGAVKENRLFMDKLDQLGLMAGGEASVEVLQEEQRQKVAV